MAMIETSPQDRQGRRRPFTTWVKKLANFKNGSLGDGGRHASSKGNQASVKRRVFKNNNPYPQSGRTIPHGMAESHHPRESQPSFSTARSGVSSSTDSVDRNSSIESSSDGRAPPTAGTRSVAATVSTDHDAQRSVAPSHRAASSITGTTQTATLGMDSRRGGDSTFSSPAPSVRSLTTTLTTMQSMAVPGGAGGGAGGAATNGNGLLHTQTGNSQVIHYQPFPSTPASAIPPHLAASVSGPGHPTTYSTATANNLLTDNASILTLASSSKRRRRRSLDTDASVRALAPSSLFGGSRESLPLSVLSANMDGNGGGSGMPVTPGLQHTNSRNIAERTSIYSATGILAAASERNSFYAKQALGPGGDGASVRSGLLGHGRADSVNGSIGGLSPLASPRESAAAAAVSERDKDLGIGGKGKDIDEGDEDAEADED